MKENIGTIDKRIRLCFGGLLLIASIKWTFILASILGVYGLLTGLFGFCPVYELFGQNTLTPRIRLNLGQTDKIIRLSAGGLFVVSYLFWPFFFNVIVGIYGLLTGLVGWCPIYQAFSLDTLTQKTPVDENGGPKQEEYE